MVLLTNKLKRLGGANFQPLISSREFIIGRDSDTLRLVVIKDNKVYNTYESLSSADLKYLREILERTKFDVFMVKDVNYIFNLGDMDERHKFVLLETIGKDYPHVLDDYDLSQFEFCSNGDVLVDSVTIPTRLNIYET